jgi:hypothetical protein
MVLGWEMSFCGDEMADLQCGVLRDGIECCVGRVLYGERPS